MSLGPKHFECDAILFDLDGVLIDSNSCIVRLWQNWADDHALDIEKIMQNAHGIRTIETIKIVAPHLDAVQEAALFEAREAQDTEGVFAIDGAAQILAALPQDTWAIVTSGTDGLVKARLKKTNLPIPAQLVTANDVRQGKPDPEPYLLGARRLGLPAERCVVLEDAPAGVTAGKRAGMRVIGIASTHTREELLAQGADLVLDQLSQLTVRQASQGYRLVIEVG
jgi:sugar-phosphatase